MQYTVLNLKEIKTLASLYDIDEIVSFKVLSGGSENTNYLLTSHLTSYVLTICEQKTTTEAINLTRLLEHLASNNFSTSEIIRTKKKEPISIYNDKSVILKTFLEGKIIKDLSPHLIELIGIQLGKLHKIDAPDYLPKKLNYGIEEFSDVALYAEHSPFHNWLQSIEEFITPYISEAIPQALIHSDVFYSNVIIEEEERSVTIMDFEEATYHYRIFDVGMTIVGLCSEHGSVQLKKVTHLLKGYVQEIDLMDEEKESLQAFTIYAAAAMTFWRHRNFNYTKPTPAMKNHYLALKNIADDLKKLPPYSFKQILEM